MVQCVQFYISILTNWINCTLKLHITHNVYISLKEICDISPKISFGFSWLGYLEITFVFKIQAICFKSNWCMLTWHILKILTWVDQKNQPQFHSGVICISARPWSHQWRIQVLALPYNSTREENYNYEKCKIHNVKRKRLYNTYM